MNQTMPVILDADGWPIEPSMLYERAIFEWGDDPKWKRVLGREDNPILYPRPWSWTKYPNRDATFNQLKDNYQARLGWNAFDQHHYEKDANGRSKKVIDRAALAVEVAWGWALLGVRMPVVRAKGMTIDRNEIVWHYLPEEQP